MDIGVLHPGEMGAAVAGTLIEAGHRVLWLPEDRSDETKERADQAGLESVGTLDEMIRRCEMLISVCPPHVATDLARQVALAHTAFEGIYLDANAISPATAEMVSSIITARGARYVDGGIIGSPPLERDTRLYLSGSAAREVAAIFSPSALEIIVIGDARTAASALKMAYATWTKGGTALLLAIRTMASYHGVDEVLLAEWNRSHPELITRGERAAISAMTKGWRWIGEMDEVAATFVEANLPDGFGRAAADVYRRVPRQRPVGDENDLDRVLRDLSE